VVIASCVGRCGVVGRSEWGFRWHGLDCGVRMQQSSCLVSKRRREGGDREGIGGCKWYCWGLGWVGCKKVVVFLVS